MTKLLLLLGAACTGGLLLLHGFGKVKLNSEKMLDAYRDMLKKAADQKEEDNEKGLSATKKLESAGSAGEPPMVTPL